MKFTISAHVIDNGMTNEPLGVPKRIPVCDGVVIQEDCSLKSITVTGVDRAWINFRYNTTESILTKEHHFISPGLMVIDGLPVDIQAWTGDDRSEWVYPEHKHPKKGGRLSMWICFDKPSKTDCIVTLAMESVRAQCCSDMDRAVSASVGALDTSSEGIFVWIAYDDIPFKPAIRFCPWCGKKVSI